MSKKIITVCENTCYVKELPVIEDLMKDESKGYPYEGAKEHYILDIENIDLCFEVLKILESVTPLPKKRKK